MNGKTLVVLVALGALLALAVQAGSWEFARTELVPGEKTIASENGRYVGRATWGADPMHPTMVGFSLAGSDERILWSSQAFGESACFIANDGKTVVGMSGSGVEAMPATLTFYGPKGEKGRQVTVKAPSGTAFSQDGSTFLVRGQDLGIGAFDRSGKKLWQVPGGRLFVPSEDGKRLAVEDQGTLFLYEQGKLLGRTSLGEPFAVALCFSPEGDYLGSATSHRLAVYRAKDLTVAWTTETKEPARSFTSVSLSRKAEATAAGVDFDAGPSVSPEQRYPKGDVVLYGAKGQTLWTQELALGGFAPHRPLVSLSPDGRTLRVTGVKETFVYEQR